MSGGGVVTAVTKSGTNAFRGDATAYWKPNSLQSHPIQVNCNCPLGQTGFNLGKMRDLSAHAGGPVLRDRLWFFAGVQDYEFTHAEPGVYPAEQPTNYWHKGQGKLTWQATPTLRVSQLLRLEWWGGYGGPSRTVVVRSGHQDARGAHPHLRDRGEQDVRERDRPDGSRRRIVGTESGHRPADRRPRHAEPYRQPHRTEHARRAANRQDGRATRSAGGEAGALRRTSGHDAYLPHRPPVRGSQRPAADGLAEQRPVLRLRRRARLCPVQRSIRAGRRVHDAGRLGRGSDDASATG